MKKFVHELSVLLRGARYIQHMDPKMIPWGLVRSAGLAIEPFITIVMTGKILDTLMGNRDVKTLVIQVLLLIGLNWLLTTINSWADDCRNVLLLSVQRRQQMILSEKLMDMDYGAAEDAKTHLLYQEIHDRCLYTGCELEGVLIKLEELFRGLLSVALSVGVTVSLFSTPATGTNISLLVKIMNSPILSGGFIALIIGSVVVSAFLGIKQNDTLAQLSSDKKFNLNNRIFDFYAKHLEDYKTGKDVRLYHQNDLIRQEFLRTKKGIHSKLGELSRCNGKYESWRVSISAAAAGLIYLFVGCKALAGLLSVGSIVRYTGSVSQFITGGSLLMTELSQLKLMTANFELFFDFLDMEEEMKQGTEIPEKQTDPLDECHEIEFRNVSFRYPGNENWVLRHVSLTIGSGEHLAMVGVNGSGKTTMIKLLCRLYDPTEGQIFLDGVDIRKYDYQEYQDLFAVVFQDFKLFALSVAENVAVGKDGDREKIMRTLQQTGLWERVERMEHGMDTPIYKEYFEDGVEISGGEAQKLAIARALYKDAAFVILDEPTAALDPISEYEIYSRFDSIVGKRTAVYISHRLSSCRFCDRIVVFNKGELVQSGSHEALLQNEKGRYYQLWNAQAQYYENVQG